MHWTWRIQNLLITSFSHYDSNYTNSLKTCNKKAFSSLESASYPQNICYCITGLNLRASRVLCIPVHNDPPVVAVVANLARDLFHRHADLHVLVVQVSQLGGDHRAIVQLHQRHGIEGVVFEARERSALPYETFSPRLCSSFFRTKKVRQLGALHKSNSSTASPA